MARPSIQDPIEKPVTAALNKADLALLESLLPDHRGSRAHVLRSALRFYAQATLKDTVTDTAA